MKFFVNVAIDGRAEVEVEAENFQEARDKARDAVWDIDAGDINIIGCDPVYAEDENGNQEDAL